jgi:SAM-dependent methyltransferase
VPDWVPRGDHALIYDYLPTDCSRQSHSMREALAVVTKPSNNGRRLRILDLGCGTGASFDEFSRGTRQVDWIGVDIADSPEVAGRTRKDVEFHTYDGIHLPISSDSVDLVYSHQVFEHVRYPEALLLEVQRVLRPEGYFIGSTSHLEPFHSRSFWNYTPFGFCVLLKQAGFHSIIVRPGIDGLSLIARRLLGFFRMANPFNFFFTRESPLNFLVEQYARLLRIETRRRNAVKLIFCGHFCFYGRK